MRSSCFFTGLAVAIGIPLSAIASEQSALCTFEEKRPASAAMPHRVWIEHSNGVSRRIFDGAVIEGRTGSRIRVAPGGRSAELAEAVTYHVEGRVSVDRQGVLHTPSFSGWRFVDPDALDIIGRVIVSVNGAAVVHLCVV